MSEVAKKIRRLFMDDEAYIIGHGDEDAERLMQADEKRIDRHLAERDKAMVGLAEYDRVEIKYEGSRPYVWWCTIHANDFHSRVTEEGATINDAVATAIESIRKGGE